MDNVDLHRIEPGCGFSHSKCVTVGEVSPNSTDLPKWYWAFSALIAFLLATGHATAQLLPLNPSHYRIISAPEFPTGRPGSARAFEWVDSERLLFLVNDRQLSETERRGDRTVIINAVPTIHLWDLRTGNIRRYRDEPMADHLCAVDGRVWYGLRRGERKMVFEGIFGEEREREATPVRINKDGSRIAPALNRFSCKEYWSIEVPRPYGGSALPLRDEHGVFERAGSNAKGDIVKGGWLPPFKWWIHFGGDSREIPLPQENISHPLAYSPLAGGYLLRREENRLARGIANRFYLWLPKTNKVRVLDVLGSQNWTALFQPSVTRLGLVAISATPTKDPRAKWDPGPAGIYLFNGSPVEDFIGQQSTEEDKSGIQRRPFGVEQIVSGLIDEMSGVSPDGCKIAAVIDPWDGERRRFRLEVIDFCGKGK